MPARCCWPKPLLWLDDLGPRQHHLRLQDDVLRRRAEHPGLREGVRRQERQGEIRPLSCARLVHTSSTAFAGKLVGALLAPFLIERWGHRVGFWILVVVVWVGIIIEATAHEVAQFIVGRIIIYFRFCRQGRR